jgi:hypothetical protein
VGGVEGGVVGLRTRGRGLSNPNQITSSVEKSLDLVPVAFRQCHDDLFDHRCEEGFPRLALAGFGTAGVEITNDAGDGFAGGTGVFGGFDGELPGFAGQGGRKADEGADLPLRPGHRDIGHGPEDVFDEVGTFDEAKGLDAAELPSFAAVILEVGVHLAVKSFAGDTCKGRADLKKGSEVALENILARGESLLFGGGE